MSLASNTKRALRAFWREAIARQTPHGLYGAAYWRRTPAPEVERHRALWRDGLPGWPSSARLAVDTWLWCRWVLFHAWTASWRAVRLHGGNAERNDGVPLRIQAARVLGLALRWSIPPAQAYAFRLHLPPSSSKSVEDPALGYVFAPEVAAWHRRVNAGVRGYAAIVALLKDKVETTRSLGSEGLPMAPLLDVIAKGSGISLAQWVRATRTSDADLRRGLFFKSRSGHAGVGAFAAWHDGRNWVARTTRGIEESGDVPVEALWQALLAVDDILAQLRLVDHPEMPSSTGRVDPVTIRVITRHTAPGTAAATMAILERPLGPRHHGMWPVCLEDGALRSSRWDGAPVNPIGADSTWPPESWRIPHWEQLRRESERAHAYLGDIAFVAWDWIVTPQGPLLLEGNSGWRVGPPQQLFGPLAPCTGER